MKKTIVISLLLVLGISPRAQDVMQIDTLSVDTSSFDNIKVLKIFSDERSSTFVIWVKHSVRSHKHMEHTENVYVHEGTGLFTLGDEQFTVGPGYHIVIPQGVAHSVQVIEGPMKVTSVQSPEFDGSDRIFLDEKK